jgi:Reverse transcriptase (RNA-dependent DNA polymerase).
MVRVLSPTLFNIIISKIGLEIKTRKNNPKILVYADDVMLWMSNAREFEENLKSVKLHRK